MKFCKDCKNRVEVQYVQPVCSVAPYPSATEFDLVTGEPSRPVQRYWPCSFVRASGGACGPDAKLFEPATQTS